MATQPICVTKVCSKCGVEKPATIDWFAAHPECKFGVHSTCRDCHAGAVGYSASRIAESSSQEDMERRGVKRCTSCQVEHPANTEHFQGLSGGKLWARCRGCVASYRREVYLKSVVAPRESKKEPLPDDIKRCRACKETKPLTDFYPALECRKGVRPECRICTIEGQTQSYFLKTEGRKRIRRRPYEAGEVRQCGTCGENKPASLDYFHAQRTRAGLSSICKKCKAEYYQSHIKLAPNYKMTRKAAKANRNARMRGKSGFVSSATLAELLNIQNGQCFYCDENLNNFHADHFIPIAKGGEHETSNLVLACPQCNHRKSSKLPWEWKPERFSHEFRPRT